MTRIELLRRSGLLCCHFLRNLAFYKAGWRNGSLITQDQFLVNANSNFLDISVLEWCKLFGDRRGKHHWRKVVANQDAFLEALLIKLKITEQEFDAYIEEMRIYRDKFIAHLDTEKIMHPPKMRVARKSVSFLYDHLLSNEQQDDCFHDAPKKASKFYGHFARLGKKAYSK